MGAGVSAESIEHWTSLAASHGTSQIPPEYRDVLHDWKATITARREVEEGLARQSSRRRGTDDAERDAERTARAAHVAHRSAHPGRGEMQVG